VIRTVSDLQNPRRPLADRDQLESDRMADSSRGNSPKLSAGRDTQ